MVPHPSEVSVSLKDGRNCHPGPSSCVVGQVLVLSSGVLLAASGVLTALLEHMSELKTGPDTGAVFRNPCTTFVAHSVLVHALVKIATET